MDINWDRHFKHYDLFQNSFSKYRSTINFHLDNLSSCNEILDSGAGSGNLTFELLKIGKRVSAIDPNKYALNILRDKCSEYKDNLSIFEIDGSRLEFEDETFDGAASMYVISFVNDFESYIKEIYRTLKKEGVFSISSWAAVEDSWEGIIGIQKEELFEKKVLPKFNSEWEYMMNSSKVAINDVVNGPNEERLISVLENAGFRDIKIRENPYGKYAYFITCKK